MEPKKHSKFFTTSHVVHAYMYYVSHRSTSVSNFPSALHRKNRNISLNNHGKDTKSQKAVLACKHLQILKQHFRLQWKCTLIEQVRKETLSQGMRKLSKQREHFWILNLKATGQTNSRFKWFCLKCSCAYYFCVHRSLTTTCIETGKKH